MNYPQTWRLRSVKCWGLPKSCRLDHRPIRGNAAHVYIDGLAHAYSYVKSVCHCDSHTTRAGSFLLHLRLTTDTRVDTPPHDRPRTFAQEPNRKVYSYIRIGYEKSTPVKTAVGPPGPPGGFTMQ